MSRHSSTKAHSSTRGFTVVELLVSIGIMGVVLTTIFLNQSTYTETADLTNLADNLSLTFRQAQVYGNAVREVTPGSSNFAAPYGISISLLQTNDGLSYRYFVDLNNNSAYDSTVACPTGSGLECLEKTDLVRGNYFDSICIIASVGTGSCSTVRRADISFARPAPAARIVAYNASGNNFTPPNMVGLKFVMKSASGRTRSISVYLSGQVSVE